MIEEKTFVLHWVNGDREEVKGMSIADAFHRAGHGYGDLKKLSGYEVKKEKGSSYIRNE